MVKFLLGVLAIAALCNFLYNSTPPIGEDELVYHISLPAQWIHDGHISFPRTNPNAFFPLNGEFITTGMLLLGGWRLAKIWVWLTGLLMAWSLYCFSRKHAGLSVEGSLWAAAVLYTMPCITSLNGTTSVDQLNLLFEILCVSCLLDWNVMGSGIWAGLSLGTRPYSVAWVLAVMIVFLRSWEEWLTFGLMAFILCVPYPIHNWIATGNPFYPKALWPGAAQDIYFRAQESQFKPKFLDYFLLPWNLSWGGLIWGCGPIPALSFRWTWKDDNDLFVLVIVMLILTALVPMTMINARYFCPLFPWLAILSAKVIVSDEL